MLKRLLLLSAVLSVLFSTATQAATVLQLDPLGGAISGLPGSTIGWGFNLSNDQNYLVVTSAAFAPATALGTFTDFISASNFFVVGPAPNANPVWAQSFDAATQTGIGSFTLGAGAAPGSVVSGQIVLTYDLFTRSPLDALFNPDTDTLSNGNLLTANASVVTVVPLPAAVWLLGSAVVGLVGFARRRQEGG